MHHCSPKIPSLLLAVAQEVAVLAGVHMHVQLEQEALIELEGTWELLHQLPHTLQELVDHWRHLLRVTLQVSVPGNNGMIFLLVLCFSEMKLNSFVVFFTFYFNTSSCNIVIFNVLQKNILSLLCYYII